MTEQGTPAVSRRAVARAHLTDPLSTVRFVDSRRQDALARLGVRSVDDLARHYPFRYLDLTDVSTLAAAPVGADVTVVGRVHDIKSKRPRPRLTVTEIAIVDGTGAIIGVWFNQPYMAQRFRIGDRVAFAGTVVFEYGLKQMRAPFVELVPDEVDDSTVARILPVHRATEGLSANWIRRLVAEALAELDGVPDPLPARIRADRGVMPLNAAYRAIHFPRDPSEARAARFRLVYEEFFVLEAALAQRKRSAGVDRAGFAHAAPGRHTDALARALPFELTGDQQRAVAEITADLAAPHPSNRLLLGDVGTGKTAVAAFALAQAADSGTQAAMMAPTEVLAAQYVRAVGPLLDAADIPWALLTGSTPASDRRRILASLAAGETTVAFGTHALLQDDVGFDHLTLALIDEQHRFGVAQRLALRSKGERADLLVMTATPIPRTLALTLYGDLDTSVLRERPRGRPADHVTTHLIRPSERARAYQQVRDAVAAGQRAYVVCALVEDSDATDATAATREAERLRRDVFPELRVGLLTGQMRPADKQRAMDGFRAGEFDVLVATTVIEIGVDVPEATVMIVENAERYGLAQLHQLRGRVGRGAAPGEVWLLADPNTDEGRARLEALLTTSDGFALAELDLAIRGEGDVLGERQSGLGLRIASLTADAEILTIARADAFELIAEDPELASAQHALLREEVERRIGLLTQWVHGG